MNKADERILDWTQRREQILKLIELNPEMSNVSIGKQFGVSENTVRRLRKTMNTESFLYFIEGGGLIKIGKASDIQNRFSQIQTMSPVELKLLAVYQNAGHLEKKIHDTLYRYRKHGEWFEPTPQVLEMIDRLDGEYERWHKQNEVEFTKVEFNRVGLDGKTYTFKSRRIKK